MFTQIRNQQINHLFVSSYTIDVLIKNMNDSINYLNSLKNLVISRDEVENSDNICLQCKKNYNNIGDVSNEYDYDCALGKMACHYNIKH